MSGQQLFKDISTVLTVTSCTDNAVPNANSYSCFFNHPPNDSTNATISGFSSSTIITMPNGIFDGSTSRRQTYADIVTSKSSGNDCYNGSCLAQPNLYGMLGNVTVIPESDKSCHSPTLNSEIPESACPSGVVLTGGCDPTVPGCLPCCTGLQPKQIGCKTVGDTTYGIYQCQPAPACVSPYTYQNGKCYLYNPLNRTCGDYIAQYDSSLQHSFYDHGGDGAWCWSEEAWGNPKTPKIEPGMWYCAGDNNVGGADCSRSMSGCWCQNTSEVPMSHVNAWYYWPPNDNTPWNYCPWPPQESDTCAAQGRGAQCLTGPSC